MNDFPKYGQPFERGEFYHIYNHAVSDELLFIEKENYRFFFKKYDQFLKKYLTTYSFCLLPNHFHLLVKVSDSFSSNEISEQFRKFFISYSKSFNKWYHRRGSLFEKHLKRVPVSSQEQLIWTIFYIHRNPVHHKLTPDFKNYIWSSYPIILSEKRTSLKRDECLKLFSGKENFIQFHERNINGFDQISDLLLE